MRSNLREKDRSSGVVGKEAPQEVQSPEIVLTLLPLSGHVWKG